MKHGVLKKVLRVLALKTHRFWQIGFMSLMLTGFSVPAAFAQMDSIRAQLFAAKAIEKLKLGQADSARYFSQSSLAFFEKTDDLAEWLKLHKDMGRVLRDEKHEPEQSMPYFEGALRDTWRKPRTNKEWKNWASLNLNIGYVCFQARSDYVCARTYYEAGRVILQDTLNEENIMLADVVLHPLGNIYGYLRDYDKASQYLQEAKKVCEKLFAWDKAAGTANDIGIMYWTKGDFVVADKWFREGLKMKELSPEMKVTLLLNLGVAVLKQGHHEEAWHLTEEAQKMLELDSSTFTPSRFIGHQADLHDNLGNLYQARRQWSEAAAHFRQSIGFIIEKFGTPNRREVAQGYLELCDLFTHQHRPDSTLHYAQTALRCLLP